MHMIRNDSRLVEVPASVADARRLRVASTIGLKQPMTVIASVSRPGRMLTMRQHAHSWQPKASACNVRMQDAIAKPVTDV